MSESGASFAINEDRRLYTVASRQPMWRQSAPSSTMMYGMRFVPAALSEATNTAGMLARCAGSPPLAISCWGSLSGSSLGARTVVQTRRSAWVTCGRRPGKNFLTFCSIGRVRSRVRPVDAAGVAAGPNALRGSGPQQNGALWKGALTQAGSPDPRNDRICIITSSCPRQLVLPIYLLARVMLPATVSAPCTSRPGP